MKFTSRRPQLILYITAFFIFTANSSCKKIESLLTFVITNECNITVNSSSPVNLPFVISTPDVTTNSSQEFQNNKTKASLVKDIRLQSLKLNITNPVSQKFDFLKSIHIYISTNASNEIELAALDNIASTANLIELIPSAAKLDEYIKASSYTLRTEVVTKQVLTNNVDIHVESKFKVTANL